MNMLVGRIHIHLHRVRPSLRTTCTCTALPNTQYFAVEYLIQSCGLSSDEALKASKYIQYLKSPHKPDAVLWFLRKIGISESDRKTAVSLEAPILCHHVENNWKPTIAKLQEIGFIIEGISGFIASHPYLFMHNFVPQINFWMRVLGSVENFSLLFKFHWCNPFSSSLEKVPMPNLSFLVEQCDFSPRRIIKLMKNNPRLISFRPDVFKMQVERTEKLGFDRSSRNFINALNTIFYLNDCTIRARLNNFTSMEFSQEEEALIPYAAEVTREADSLIGNKIEYLTKEAGCDEIDVVTYPVFLTYSLEKRLIP